MRQSEVGREAERTARAEEARERELREARDVRAPAGTARGAASWQEIKGRFVDDPAGALAAAEELVRTAVDDRIRRLKEGLEELRMVAEGDKASTEDQRTRLLRYQAYYERLSEPIAH
jgi:hypothetical protein